MRFNWSHFTEWPIRIYNLTCLIFIQNIKIYKKSVEDPKVLLTSDPVNHWLLTRLKTFIFIRVCLHQRVRSICVKELHNAELQCLSLTILVIKFIANFFQNNNSLNFHVNKLNAMKNFKNDDFEAHCLQALITLNFFTLKKYITRQTNP